jgi:tRNA pseudouridine55 synthase
LSGDGVLLIDKPAGVTSHDVVAAERRKLASADEVGRGEASAGGEASGRASEAARRQPVARPPAETGRPPAEAGKAAGRGRGVKVGHAGTLDPFATGLLLVLVGRATRAQRFLMALPKRYEAVARLGFTSTTGDVDGEIAPGRMPGEPLALPTGRIRQRPPAYSAVRVGGKRAYALARAGEAVDVPEREVDVHRFELLWREGERAGFAIECGSGTYVRSLVADLGDAYCLKLRRTGIGPFDVADAGRFVGLADALAFLPAVELEGEDARRAGHGVAVLPRPGASPPDASPLRSGSALGTVRLVDADGLIALAEPRGDGTLKPVVGFRG